MKMKRKLILSLLAMLLPISAWCADGDKFSVTVESITESTPKTLLTFFHE